ncbi:MAG: hypothetical protein ACYCW6_13345 [Candidatus Xenobia bacterium]
MKHAVLALLWLGFFSGAALAQFGETPNPYAHINTDSAAQALFKDVRAKLKEMYGMEVYKPVVLKLVDGPAMDALFSNSPYKGAEVGLYRTEADGLHHIYVLTDDSRDDCGGTMAHEYTHAWQVENCPADQELALREGFAEWINYKYWQATGAYAAARNLAENTEDVVYGVGIKTMLAWEDKIGDKALVERVKHVSKLTQGPQ